MYVVVVEYIMIMYKMIQKVAHRHVLSYKRLGLLLFLGVYSCVLIVILCLDF